MAMSSASSWISWIFPALLHRNTQLHDISWAILMLWSFSCHLTFIPFLLVPSQVTVCWSLIEFGNALSLWEVQHELCVVTPLLASYMTFIDSSMTWWSQLIVFRCIQYCIDCIEVIDSNGNDRQGQDGETTDLTWGFEKRFCLRTDLGPSRK